MHKAELSKISIALKSGLPGWEAQKKMSPVDSEKYRHPKETSKQAAVIALLYPDAHAELQLVYIKRTSNHPDDKHGGQISFPGGQAESMDKDMLATGLRELEEELGIPASQVEVLGALSSLYIYISDFQVYPYIAYIDQVPSFQIEIAEVAYPISIPVRTLLETPIPKTDIHIRGVVIKDVPYYNLNGEILWGATAMITNEILALLR